MDAEETGTNSRSEEEPRHPDSKFKFSFSILCYYVLLAQLIERQSSDQRVVGSIPWLPASFDLVMAFYDIMESMCTVQRR